MKTPLQQPICNAADALTQALILANTAPTERQAAAAVALAEEFAAKLSPKTVDRCKTRAARLAQ